MKEDKGFFPTTVGSCLWTFGLLTLAALCYALSAWVSLAASSIGDHGNTLDEYIENVRDLDYETMALFDTLGVKYYETTNYNRSCVEYSSYRLKEMSVATLGSFILVHNHPLDVPFSITDLTNDHSNICREIVVSSEHIYILEAPNGWPAQKEVDEYFELALSQFYSDEAGCQTAPRFFEFVPGNKNARIVTTDALLEDFAGKFDLVYTVISIDEWKKAQ